MSRALAGRICLVTGANSGVGLAVARGLAERGATVVLGCRSRERGEAAVDSVRRATGNDRVTLELVDLSLQQSVRDFAARFARSHERLDVLVNNAAVWPACRELTNEGIELTWATNVLGPFLLTRSLLGQLRAGKPARIINVASLLALWLDLDDVEMKRRTFRPTVAYAQSKQAVLMLTAGWSERLQDATVTANAVHPGAVGTSLFARHRGPIGTFLSWGLNFIGRPPEDGADTILWLATDPAGEHETGKLWWDRRGRRCPYGDPKARARLWELCERMCLPAGAPQS